MKDKGLSENSEVWKIFCAEIKNFKLFKDLMILMCLLVSTHLMFCKCGTSCLLSLQFSPLLQMKISFAGGDATELLDTVRGFKWLILLDL